MVKISARELFHRPTIGTIGVLAAAIGSGLPIHFLRTDQTRPYRFQICINSILEQVLKYSEPNIF